MKKERLQSIIKLCDQYLKEKLSNQDNSLNIDNYFDHHKKYIALEIIDAFKCGELDNLLKSILKSEKNEIIKTYGFMDNEGDLKTVSFTEDHINRGELRAHIAYMKEEGYTYMGEEN